ncbi:immune inhibitor A domain-containing protein [Nocardioides sp. R-C-SC26]|uniref:immune inhibitor A domain-containing protein n=1 Tax=Nocardioides sp. R-C-SC26 TaxID=2870414 RepID=UPI001E2D2391|nr:immune inhibitor A domain-containing protein [Nocardioides sp. R-C-SC26]
MLPTLRRPTALLIAVAASVAFTGTLSTVQPATAGAPVVARELDDPDHLGSVELGDAIDVPEIADIAQLLRQPDGFAFRAVVDDLEHGGLFETEDGFSVDRGRDGVWRYVRSVTSSGRAVLGRPVSAAGAPAGLARHAGRHQVRLSNEEKDLRSMLQLRLQTMARQLAPQAEVAARTSVTPKVFNVPALMLATWFDKAAGETQPQFHAPSNTEEYFTQLLDGFGGNPRGTMTQFYYEASFGQFLVNVDVYGTYTSALSLPDPCYYGYGDGSFKITDPAGSVLGLGGLGALGMAAEAVPQAVDVPWRKYDNDGDGVVDFLMMIHSGGGREVTSDPCQTHSHAIEFTALASIATGLIGINAETLKIGLPTTTPGVFVNRVVTIPEYESHHDPLTIGVGVHEMAHAIGEPDYYDTTYFAEGTGDWDVMAGGSYLGNPAGSNPPIFNPASRVFQGWVTPTIVRGNLRNYRLKPRTVEPRANYRVGTPDPNLLLVPAYEIKLGQKDKVGHTWTAEDVYGLAYDKVRKTYVVEGYYVENLGRNTRSASLHARDPMGSMFDRQLYSSGLAVWHFDYYRRSTTYFGRANDAQDDANRYQMDLEEFDRNDNTQELQLGGERGNPGDLLTAAATGITSGTRMLAPGLGGNTGNPQKPVELSGTTTPLSAGTASFTVGKNAANESMTVTARSDMLGDCKLRLVDPRGNAGTEVDGGSFGETETLTVKNPMAGTWKVVVADYLLCTGWSGRVVFAGGTKAGFNTAGAADTWSNWSKKPTGWAFTNVRGYGNGLDMSQEAGASTNDMRLDVVNLARRADVSPGFVTGRRDGQGGSGTVTAGVANELEVPIFSNGGRKPGAVTVVVREAGEGARLGRVVASRRVVLSAYERKNVRFRYRPAAEGPVRLAVTVDPRNRVKEGVETNQTQVTDLWAGAPKARVLIVDDSGTFSEERAIQGALSAIGVASTTYVKHPSFAQMRSYDAVIWSSATARYEGILDKFDRAQVQRYLDRGGKVLLTGSGALSALTNPGSEQSPASVVGFGARYFGVRRPFGVPTYGASQDGAATFTGVGALKGKTVRARPGPRAGAVSMAGLAAGGRAIDGTRYRPFGKAAGLLVAPTLLLDTVPDVGTPAYAGVLMTGDRKHRGFRTAAIGWNLGDTADLADAVVVLRAVMRHFGVPTGAPLRSPSTIVHTTSVRDSVSGRPIDVSAVVLGARGADGVVTPTLYYRRHGRGSFYAVPMSRTSGAGTWAARIPGNAVTPEGVDYYIRSGSTFAPDGGGQGEPLYYGVAVATPMVAKPVAIR